uniref:Uncharacterized protein n=1 Tax=Leptospirillum ferriphilum TaxID=178606 RepID=A0A7C3QUD1_9BACT
MPREHLWPQRKNGLASIVRLRVAFSRRKPPRTFSEASVRGITPEIVRSNRKTDRLCALALPGDPTRGVRTA